MKTLVYVDGLTVSFDGFLALRSLNLIVEPSERVRLIIGPNGAGKTTLFDVLTGQVAPTGGRVLFRDTVDLHSRTEHEIANLGIGRKFQTPSIFSGLTVLENMVLAAGKKRFGSTLAAGAVTRDRDAAIATLGRVGLEARVGAVAGALSHGEKQWLEIAMLLVQAPSLLLLDEPVAGMTRPEKEQTVALIEDIANRGDCAVLLIEHDMEFVRQVARAGHTVTVMHEGGVLAEGPLDRVQADERVVEAYLGRGRLKRQRASAEVACSG